MERLRKMPHLVGRKQSEKAIRQGRAEAAYLAADADPWLRESFLSLCEEMQVSVVMAPSGKELAKACRVEVPTACAVLLQEEAEKL